MRIKHMFKKTVRDIRGEEHENTPEVPDNLMRKCNACKAAVFVDEVKQNHYICPHCGNYFHVPAGSQQASAHQSRTDHSRRCTPGEYPHGYRSGRRPGR